MKAEVEEGKKENAYTRETIDEMMKKVEEYEEEEEKQLWQIKGARVKHFGGRRKEW